MSNLNDSAFPIPLNPGSSYQGHGPADGFSKRERACIDLRIPESGDVELDALIEKARRQEFAAKVLCDSKGDQGLLSHYALSVADALIAEIDRTDG